MPCRLRVKAYSSETCTYEVPGDDLTTDTDGFVSSVGKLASRLLDDFAVNLVGPATIVAEGSGRFGDL